MSNVAADPPVQAVAPSAAPLQRPNSPADRFMRRVLHLPEDGPRASAAAARTAFRTSIMVATVRCLLMYIVLPFVLPIIGIATDAAAAIVLPINIAAIVAIVMSIRRFWRADHSKRWHYTVLGTCVIGFLVVATIAEIVALFR